MNEPQITDNPKELDPRRHDTPPEFREPLSNKAKRRLRMMKRAAKHFRLMAAVGLRPPRDVIAEVVAAGEDYTGFPSVERVK